MGRFLPYTHYPVYKIPALFLKIIPGNIEYVMTSMLLIYRMIMNSLTDWKMRKKADMCKNWKQG